MTASPKEAIRVAKRARAEYDRRCALAEEALTVYFEQHLRELALRYPRRCFEASSGMGSLSIEITARGNTRPLEWIWRSEAYGWADWKHIWKEWEQTLDDFASELGADYVNFTRDIIVEGERYANP